MTKRIRCDLVAYHLGRQRPRSCARRGERERGDRLRGAQGAHPVQRQAWNGRWIKTHCAYKTHSVFIQRPWACHEEAQHEALIRWGIVGTGLIPVWVAQISGDAGRTNTTRGRAIPKNLCCMMASEIGQRCVARSRLPWLQKVKCCIIATRRGCDAM